MLSDGVPLTFDTEFNRHVHYEVTCRHCDESMCVCVCVGRDGVCFTNAWLRFWAAQSASGLRMQPQVALIAH